MTVFLLLALLLLVAVLVPLVLALRRAPAVSAPDRERLNVSIFRERQAELDAERDSGRIDAGQHAALTAELQQLLVDDVDAGTVAAPAARAGSPRRVAFILLALVPLLVAGLHVVTGFDEPARDWLALQSQRDAVAALPPQPDPAVIQQEGGNLRDIARLRQTMLERRPADADAWFRLGLTWLDAEVPVLAMESLRTARRLAPERVDIAVTLARVELMLGKGQLTDEIRELLDFVLTVQPDHQGALLVYGMAAFDSRDYATAIARWEQLLARLDPASEGARLLRQSVARAQEQQAAAGAPAAPGAAAGRIPVRVVLASSLGVPPPDATLFVIVRAAGGPPMPVAAKRLPARLPVDIVITDADQMIAGAPLAERGPLEVLARLSRSGTPMASSGDLQSTPVRIGLPLAAPVTINIDQRVP
ncbi:MAG: c-type cytochrome biogenesis protein CcmI [Pseudomonadota bacterium]